jgi:hypothetical protein
MEEELFNSPYMLSRIYDMNERKTFHNYFYFTVCIMCRLIKAIYSLDLGAFAAALASSFKATFPLPASSPKKMTDIVKSSL